MLDRGAGLPASARPLDPASETLDYRGTPHPPAERSSTGGGFYTYPTTS
ncbi:hypothetical protein MTO96_047231, partial [Rhipicephalus appendiculatus]